MSRPRISSELEEAVALLGAIREDTRQRGGRQRGRGERLQRGLVQLCARGRFRGAAIADEHALPIAVHGSPFRGDALGAAISILGQALVSIGKVIGQPELQSIAVDVGLDEKLVVRPLRADGVLYYLAVLCAIGVDERSELELSMGELAAIVGEDGAP